MPAKLTKSRHCCLESCAADHAGRSAPLLDPAITTALTLRAVFRLALRQTEGLIGSILELLGLDLPVPNFSTLSRRARNLELPAQPRATGVHLLVDSSGLKLGGPGEWRSTAPASGARGASCISALTR